MAEAIKLLPREQATKAPAANESTVRPINQSATPKAGDPAPKPVGDSAVKKINEPVVKSINEPVANKTSQVSARSAGTPAAAPVTPSLATAPKEPAMQESEGYKAPEIIEMHKTPVWIGALVVLALLITCVTSAWVYVLQSHVTAAETNLEQANVQNTVLKEQLDDTNLRLKAQGTALGQRVGLSEKQLASKSDQLVAEEKREIAIAAKLQQQRLEATNQRVNSVQSDVSSVRTDVNEMKTDVATTQAEQASIKKSIAKVDAKTDDLGLAIATNAKQLNVLKHKGERTFYQFAIERGAKPINLGTIKVSTPKVDVKNNRFTLIIDSDDKRIEKRDQTLNQAITFYSGKDPQLFEIVVNGISKKMIAGYLSVPNDAPKPMNP